MIVSVGFLALSACDDSRHAGPLRTQTRPVDAFDSIEMQGAARLEITVGQAESLVIEGREAALERVRTQVRGDTLHIRSKSADWLIRNSRPGITLRITVPQLRSLELEGGNDVRLAGFDGGETRIKVMGATHIEARGRLNRLTVHMAGAGHGDFSRLAADAAKVTVDGVASVIVHPKDSLDATMNGVGAILYTGSPREVSTRMNGLGTIGKRDRSRPDARQRSEPIDPDTLQPEYDERSQKNEKKTGESTEVI